MGGIYMKSKGFTLIEVLISLVILSMTFSLAGYAYTMYIDNFEKLSTRLSADNFESIDLINLEKVFSGMTLYSVQKKGVQRPYFKGLPNKLRFVSNTSFYELDQLLLAELSVETDSDSGRQVLIYREYNIDTNPNINFPLKAELLLPHRKEYLLTADSINFSYYASASISELLGGRNTEHPLEFENFDAEIESQLPIYIAFNIKNQGRDSRLIQGPISFEHMKYNINLGSFEVNNI
ncbi:type II secretion system protein [Pseudoalteromonas piratica]|uniref:Prepilin-type N-terminal cleavage/methylation domain-containing protein n=1 Tax=Pseudoalteromonas piratica TaxID=1348114 RepID=A0A0A7ED62_9GAMM|nr:prepilin-type N-terminal cleavage/methylation domain-containing protein [Pseudoalteromonas piratica]AIY64580.1 hypothetical protein OM33_05015 [Pseudoalteromonas piratica]